MPGDELVHDDYFVASLPADHASLLLEEIVALILLDVLDDKLVGLVALRVLRRNFAGVAAFLLDLLLWEDGSVLLRKAHLVGAGFDALLQPLALAHRQPIELRQPISNP